MSSRRQRKVNINFVFLFIATLQFIIYSAAIAGTSSEIFLLRERANYTAPRIGLRLAESSLNYLSIEHSSQAHILDSITSRFWSVILSLWFSVQLIAWSKVLFNFRLSVLFDQAITRFLLNVSSSISYSFNLPLLLTFPHSVVGKAIKDRLYNPFSALAIAVV